MIIKGLTFVFSSFSVLPALVLVVVLLGRSVLLDLLLGSFLLFFIIVFNIVLILTIFFFSLNLVIKILIIFDFLIEILIFLFFLGLSDDLLGLGNGGRGGLGSGLNLLDLSLLLRRLGFLLRGSSLERGSCLLLDFNFFLFAFLFFLFSLSFFLIRLTLNIGHACIFLVGLEESGDVEGAVALDGENDLIEEGDENIDDCVRLFFGEGSNQELLVLLLDEERSGIFGAGSQHNIGDGEHLALRFLCVLGVELEALTLVQDFAEEHFWLLIIYPHSPNIQH
jgi:hypothetical protein